MYSAIIIGSGFSGLCMAIKLKDQGIHDFVILEKGNEVGGTWRENTYPGAECDIPSALYSYSFEPYPFWEYKWSHQPQILEYLKHCAKKYDLYKDIRFESTLISATWVEKNNYWNIKTSDGQQIDARTFIPAVGQLHHPSIPEQFKHHTFHGESWHSAQWNHKVDLKNKTVAVIGNAASAVQFIPEIAKEAKSVKVFQRSANWMLPKQDRLYKDWEKKMVARFPILLKMYRLRLWLQGGGLFSLMKNGNNGLRKYYQSQTIKFIKKHIKDPKLISALTPKYPMGAKRILISDNYYKALAQENVDLILDPIDQMTDQGIQTKEGQYDVDYIIFSTGFKTNPFLLNLEIIGRNNLSIQDAWKEGPINYYGMTVSGFPNMFMMYGPNTNLGHNSIIIMAEAQATYIAQAVKLIKQQENLVLEIKPNILKDHYEKTQSRLQKMIWSQVEQSWYKSENGNIPNNWPGRTMEYMWKLRKFDVGDYVV